MMTAAAVGSTPPARTSNARTSTPRRRASRSMAHDCSRPRYDPASPRRSEEHTSELQSLRHLVCRLLLEKKKKVNKNESNTDGENTRSWGPPHAKDSTDATTTEADSYLSDKRCHDSLTMDISALALHTTL